MVDLGKVEDAEPAGNGLPAYHVADVQWRFLAPG